MLPSATELRYFVEIAKTSNLSRAAVRLGITQPALTQAMKKLEASVGSKLLLRTRTGVQLTKAGERIAGQAGHLLEMWESVQAAAQADDTEIKGRYRLGCHPSVGSYILPKFFNDLATQAPSVEIQLTHDLSRRITEAVIDFRIDLAFVVNPVAHPDLVLKKLGTDVVTVFEAERGRYESDLFGDPELLQTQYVLKKLGSRSLPVRRFVGCPNLEVIRALVTSGAGFGILPSRVARCGSGPRLHPVGGMPSFHDEIYLIYRADALASRAGKALVSIALAALVG
ncbi:LysR family transcriptional regulator [Pendulispora albinea]|uniref:LysR family transcriptional regulator n=1 Tax=Pendulispora albinea TaxID=2741071 RepID=A0ABZ2M5Q5_9BACT